MTRLISLLAALSFLFGCGADEPVHAGMKTAEEAKTLNERATPLREEVDEVGVVRDQVLKNTGQD
jgi:hypothetical protein